MVQHYCYFTVQRQRQEGNFINLMWLKRRNFQNNALVANIKKKKKRLSESIIQNKFFHVRESDCEEAIPPQGRLDHKASQPLLLAPPMKKKISLTLIFKKRVNLNKEHTKFSHLSN